MSWPDLFTKVLPSLGVGSLIGVCVGYYFQRQTWINDNKKAEWRELIDVLNECIDKMEVVFESSIIAFSAAEQEDANWHTHRWRGTRIIRDRIFISEAIEKHGIEKEWSELLCYIMQRELERDKMQQGGVPTSAGYTIKAAGLRDLLNRTARLDLGIKPGRSMWMHATGKKES